MAERMNNRSVPGPLSTRENILRGWWVTILLFASAVRFYRLDWSALWFDEAYSWFMTNQSLADGWALSAEDVHPPLYYFFLKGWIGLFGSTLISLRALSACAGVITTALGMWLTQLIATRRAACFAGVFLAMLPIAVRYSHEVRMYALLSLWTTGATIAFIYWVNAPRRRRYLAAYAVLIAAGLYTHYFVMLAVMAHWLYLLTLRKSAHQQHLRLVLQPGWWAANMAAAVLFLPWLPSFIAQLAHTGGLGWIRPVTLYSVPSAVWQYLILNDGKALPALLYWGLVPLLLILCAYCVARDSHPQRRSVLMVIYLWVPLLVMFAVSLRFPLFIARYFLFSALALPVLLGIGLDRLMIAHRWLGILGLVFVVGIEATGIRNLYGEYDHTNDDGRPTRDRINVVADRINRHYRPSDQIIVLNSHWYRSLVFYNSTAATPLLYAPAPTAEGAACLIYCRLEAPSSPGSKAFYLESLERLASGISRVWLVDGIRDFDDALSIPCDWRLVNSVSEGDNRLRLYELSEPGATQTNSCAARR